MRSCDFFRAQRDLSRVPTAWGPEMAPRHLSTVYSWGSETLLALTIDDGFEGDRPREEHGKMPVFPVTD